MQVFSRKKLESIPVGEIEGTIPASLKCGFGKERCWGTVGEGEQYGYIKISLSEFTVGSDRDR